MASHFAVSKRCFHCDLGLCPLAGTREGWYSPQSPLFFYVVCVPSIFPLPFLLFAPYQFLLLRCVLFVSFSNIGQGCGWASIHDFDCNGMGTVRPVGAEASDVPFVPLSCTKDPSILLRTKFMIPGYCSAWSNQPRRCEMRCSAGCSWKLPRTLPDCFEGSNIRTSSVLFPNFSKYRHLHWSSCCWCEYDMNRCPSISVQGSTRGELVCVPTVYDMGKEGCLLQVVCTKHPFALERRSASHAVAVVGVNRCFLVPLARTVSMLSS